jgi:hypothetical protein
MFHVLINLFYAILSHPYLINRGAATCIFNLFVLIVSAKNMKPIQKDTADKKSKEEENRMRPRTDRRLPEK